ncbi:hypothetical protein BMS3Abin03_00139 [bacterium BMS3Abin03]|nr:hypothetical protein BMS3Abin03_00139 [bacterium BMS3Abin03]
MKTSLALVISIFLHVSSIALVGYVFNQVKMRPKHIAPDFVEIVIMKNLEPVEKKFKTEKKPEKEKALVKSYKEKKNYKRKTPHRETRWYKSKSNHFMSFSDENIDTASLYYSYSDPTYSVKLKYPKGWTFLDQSIKNKLNGVTFWKTSGNSTPPPFIRLKVVDKNNFNPDRFSNSKIFDKFTVYFNDPTFVDDMISQTIYIRTNKELDFIIDLIVKEDNEFRNLQPKFYGMIKTLEVRKGLL